MRGSSLRLLLALALVSGLARGTAAQTASPSLVRGLELEQASKWREAVTAYRQALTDGDVIAAVLGLERVYAQMGHGELLIPTLDTLLLGRPRDAQLRSVQL